MSVDVSVAEPELKRTSRLTVLTLSILTVAAALLRAIGLNGGLWFDEIVTLIRSVRPPFRQIITQFPNNNNHPLYSALGHGAVVVFGDHPWSLRLPAYLFGVATVPVLYLLGRAVTTRREALLAAALLTVSYHHIWFSQNARGYTALALLTMLVTLLLIRGLEQNRTAWYVGYAVAAALGTYTHLTMGFVIAAHVIACSWALCTGSDLGFQGPAGQVNRGGIRRQQRIDWRLPALGFALAAVFSLLLYLPLLVQVQEFFAAPPSAGAQVASQRWAFGETLRGLRIGLGVWGTAATSLLLAQGLWSYFRQSRLAFALFVLPGALTLIGTVILRRPTFPRFFFFLIGFSMLATVRGAMNVGKWGARVWTAQRGGSADSIKAGAIVVGVLMLDSIASLGYGYRYPKQDFEGAMRFVEGRARDEPVGTVGLAVLPYHEYYAKPSWTALETHADFEKMRAHGRRVWLVYTFPVYIEVQDPQLMAVIRRDCPPVAVFRGTVGGGDVVVCATRSSAMPRTRR